MPIGLVLGIGGRGEDHDLETGKPRRRPAESSSVFGGGDDRADAAEARDAADARLYDALVAAGKGTNSNQTCHGATL